jgi:hypothetical protein
MARKRGAYRIQKRASAGTCEQQALESDGSDLRIGLPWHVFVFRMEVGFMLRTILIVILVLALLGSLPTWPYSAGWGYYPSGGLGLILLIIIIFALL